MALAVALSGTLSPAVGQHADTPLTEHDVREVGRELMSVSQQVLGRPISATIEVASECGETAVQACTISQADPAPVYVTPGMLGQVIGSNRDLLAFILGHELGHVALKDQDWPGRGGVVSSAIGRDLETAADSVGMLLAVAAGYSYSEAVKGILRLADDSLTSTFEALRSTHPSWWDRAAFLSSFGGDQMQAALWHAMASFQDGVYFLTLQQYELAERAFEEVTAEFPGAYEAWANLGYSRLMRYCDSLELEDVQRYQIGHLVVGGFYDRAESLRTLIRGVDTDLWWDAVGALREALRLGEQQGHVLTLARANLGIAYLVHPSGQRDEGAAARHLEAAAASAGSDSALSAAARSAVLVNHAVALLASGETNGAAILLEDAQAQSESGRSGLTEVDAAITYNQGLLSLAKGTSGTQEALVAFEDYLMRSSPSSVWWREAYRMYAQTATGLGRTVRSEAEYRQRNLIAAGPNLVTSVRTDLGEISLNQPMSQAASSLDATVVDTLIAGTNVMRFVSAERGLSIIGNERVLAIVVTSPDTSFPVERARSVDGSSVRVGMTREAFTKALGDYADYYEPTPFLDPGTTYYYYRDLGLAVRFEGAFVAELVIVQIP